MSRSVASTHLLGKRHLKKVPVRDRLRERECVVRRPGRHRRPKDVPALLQRLHERGLHRIVVEGLTDLADAVVQPLIKFDKCGIAPDARAQMFARNDLTGLLEQHSQNTQRLGLNLDRALLTEKPSSQGIEFEIAETQPFVGAACGRREILNIYAPRPPARRDT